MSELNNETEVIDEAEVPMTAEEYRRSTTPIDVALNGRRQIYCSFTKKEVDENKLFSVLPKVLEEHQKNSDEIDYLWRYYKGNQPILSKTKTIRAEINNKVLENHAFEIIEFKKASAFGEPVQYVQKGEKDSTKINPEISLLNKFMESEDKSSLDNELGEWRYVCGTAYRWVEKDSPEEEDEAPFEMSIPDPRNTFVVYSSGIKKEQVFSGYITYHSENVYTDENKPLTRKYRIITVYTDENIYRFKEVENNFYIESQNIIINGQKTSTKKYPLLIKGQRIIEYPLNNARMGLIELVSSLLNAINRIKSDDIDAIDQFVQSLLVFFNVEVDPVKFKTMSKQGIIELVSNRPDIPADVKALTQQLLHSETKVVADDLYNNALTICGVPRNASKASGGDTGTARQMGEGWETSYLRAKLDDLSFKKSEKNFLRLVLKICKADTRKSKDKIKDITIADIDIKLPRDKSDNLLVKAQSLVMLLQGGVHPEDAFASVGLFGDPHDLFLKSQKYLGDDFWKGGKTETEGIEVKTDIKDETKKQLKVETENPKDKVDNKLKQK